MATKKPTVGYLLLFFLVFNTAQGRPGIRTPPKSLIHDDNGQELKVASSFATIPEKDVEGGSAVPSEIKLEAETNPAQIQPTGRQPSSVRLTQISSDAGVNGTKMNRNFETTHHMGVAVPLTQEDFEKEMNDVKEVKHTMETSTSKEGISTWILLSGTNPTKSPPIKYSQRFESKIDRVPKPNVSETPKATTTKPTAAIKNTTTAKVDNKFTEVHVQTGPSTVRRKKPANEQRPVLVTKKRVQKVTTASPEVKETTTPTTTLAPVSVLPKTKSHSGKRTTTSTTAAPSTTKSQPSTTLEPTTVTSDTAPMEVPTTTVETTTFLILEPKDADFDLPQDRSPGPTTKKPKRTGTNKTKNKKNQNKVKTDVAEKKPTKAGPANTKDKPISTQIYNYLAREIIPTVGVGLVGLAVTAGLATYFLGPFGGLRRSYDVADRKDDMYFYNNEEYAGSDGQSEEEVFGKVIAGMPVNSPYRNSIKYSAGYQPTQQNQIQYSQYRPGPAYPKHGAAGPAGPASSPYRYRTNGSPYQPHMHSPGYGVRPQAQPQSQPQPQPQMQPQSQMQPQPQMQSQPQDVYGQQQYFRYNNEMNTVYRSNAKLVPNSQRSKGEYEDVNQVQSQNVQKFDITMPSTQPQPFTSPMVKQTQDHPEYQKKPEEQSITIEDNSEKSNDIPDPNTLRRRSQFVVGSIQAVDPSDSLNTGGADTSSPAQVTVDSVPEHGPRRRRRRDVTEEMLNNEKLNEINDSENEIFQHSVVTEQNGVVASKPGHESVTDQDTDMEKVQDEPAADGSGSMDESIDTPISPSTSSPDQSKPDRNIFEMIRNILEIKFLMGLNFLQNTTEAFQRYLKDVERRFEEAKIFSRPH